MTEKRGPANRGQGRHVKTAYDQPTTGTTPLEELWQYLANHYGQDGANDAHLFFNARKRAYEKRRRDEILERRKREQTITFPAKRRHKQSK